jgi:hypothetical protein
MTAHELTGAAICALMSTRPNHSRRQLSWRMLPVPPGHAAQTAIGNRSMQGPFRVETEDWLLPLRLSEYPVAPSSFSSISSLLRHSRQGCRPEQGAGSYVMVAPSL